MRIAVSRIYKLQKRNDFLAGQTKGGYPQLLILTKKITQEANRIRHEQTKCIAKHPTKVIGSMR